jgi:hypothetical protein
VLHQIGVGALGPVFRTYEPARDRLVAVKVFRLDITPEQAQALADELTTVAQAGLFHPSIVEPIAAGVQGTVAYRAEEYVPAESLDVAMRHYAPAPPERVLPFITQLAGAVDFARAAGVGHGALHLRDIFVTPDEARATGFGVVDALERVGLRAPVRRPYSPPERIAGGAWSTPADVFSLAAIAFELLTGRRPSGTGDQIGALTGPHAELLHAVLARAMHEDPARRPSSALAFVADLESAARGVPASAVVAAPAALDRPEAAVGTGRPVREFDSREVEPPPIAAPASALAHEPDDIAAERDEDEAHWDLSLHERRAADVEADEPPTPFAPAQIDEAADRLALDAADLALEDSPGGLPRAHERLSGGLPRADEPVSSVLPRAHEPVPPIEEPQPRDAHSVPIGEPSLFAPASKPEPEFADENGAPREAPVEPYRSVVPLPPRPAASAAAPHATRMPPPEHFDQLSLEQSGESRIVIERTRTAMLPVAVGVIIGLLVGFLAGALYMRGRGDGQAAAVADNAAAPAPASAAPAPDRPRDETLPASTAAGGGAPPASTAAAGGAPPAAPDIPTEPRAEVRAPVPAPAPPAEATPAPPARTGRIVVQSTPARAAVTVNGSWRGRTPLTLDELTFGKYVVRVVAEGYAVGREEFTLSAANAERSLSVRLQRLPAATARGTAPRPGGAAPAPAPAGTPNRYTGSVFVDSRPQGAKVFISGKEYGTTPLKIPEVPIGSHMVRLELADHQTWQTAIQVSAGKDVRVTGSLEPIR